MSMKFEATYDSVHQHQIPAWYNDAKFGIFVHWSLFSVPAYAAEQTKDISTIMEEEGMAATFANMPYAEWYLNSLRIPGSPTQAYHKKHYGDKEYWDFQKDFEEQNANLNVTDWAKFFKKAGAKYVVLVTKHHDGYTLWPTDTPNPILKDYYSKRDFVGELTDAVRAEDMKMGLYYSGVFDWTFKTEVPIDGPRGMLEHKNMSQEYINYSVAHFKELIDKYKPSVLWNDIGFPIGYDLNELFSYYYNNVEDGVINDRWGQDKIPTTEEEWEAVKEKNSSDAFAGDTLTHYDFKTPEYQIYEEIPPYKWETTRGIGRSFGFNRTESGSDYLTGKEIIDMLVRVVSRNGNLLLNIGPRADGSIPFEQMKPLLEVGAWLDINGEGIYGTRPNDISERKDGNDEAVIFTQNDEAVFATSLLQELPSKLTIKDFNIPEGRTVTLLGTGNTVYENIGNDVVITIPENYTKELAYTFKISK